MGTGWGLIPHCNDFLTLFFVVKIFLFLSVFVYFKKILIICIGSNNYLNDD